MEAPGAMKQVDPLYYAQLLFKRRSYEDCAVSFSGSVVIASLDHANCPSSNQTVCTKLLEKNPYDKAAWYLKARALTEAVRIDETELEDEGLAEVMLDENATAKLPRPGTSFARPMTNQGSSRGIRPTSKTGRPVSGFARPGTQSGRPSTMEQAVKTPRTAAGRPVTTASGRYVRLGTASMLQDESGAFINVAKLDLPKYAKRPALAKALFLYLLHVDEQPVKALELAAHATEHQEYQDQWWKAMLGFCYHRLGMFRDAEKQLQSSMKQQPTIFGAMLLAKVYIRLDQPQNALRVYSDALVPFADDTVLLAAQARVYEGIGDLTAAVGKYKNLLDNDSTNVEAIASLAAEEFYADQPELALLLYRRLLQMGVASAELFNNLGLSCFQAQQYDMALSCFERALTLAEDTTMSDIWYNISHVCLSLGDVTLTEQCLKLAVTYDSSNAEAYNNLGVIEQRSNKVDAARGHYLKAIETSAYIHEPHYNYGLISFNHGDMSTAQNECQAALKLYEDHVASQQLLLEIKQLLRE
eukprot:m.66933 g.66933  ORF g.66933 m.66933 type:complete len:528 (-) comp14067_c0_seq2:87-1670(-)